MKTKLLFITTVDVFAKSTDGLMQESRRHREYLEKIYGDDSIKYLMICKGKSNGNREFYLPLLNRALNALFFIKGRNFTTPILLPVSLMITRKIIKKMNPETIFLDSSLLGGVIPHRLSSNIVVFFHNIESEKVKNKIKNKGIWYYPIYLSAWINEKRAIKHANKMICLNDRDAQLLYKIYGKKAELVLPCSFYDKFDIQKVKLEIQREILFVGTLFASNEDGIKWFIDNVMPSLQDVTLHIVGKGFEKKRGEFTGENVVVDGFVENVGDYYYRIPIVVIPLLYGAGMKLKTAEAMMYGKCIIASDEALQGYDTNKAEHIYRCNTAEEFVKAIENAFSIDYGKGYLEDVREVFIEKYESSRQYERFRKFMINET